MKKIVNTLIIALVLILASGCSSFERLIPGRLTPPTPTAPVPPTTAPAPTAAPQPTDVPVPASAATATAPVPPTAVLAASERWIGPGKQLPSLPYPLVVEDGGATFLWAGRFKAIFPGGKVGDCSEGPKKECVLVVIGRTQIQGQDNNMTVQLPENSFQFPYASYNWLQNQDGQASPAQIKSLKGFKELVAYSHANNCGGGCNTIEVYFYNTEGTLLEKVEYKK